ncbi:MAG: 4Fe-4S dicluster domain-containing protein [Acidobacteriales bacterium]|jgi:heterodisulfide reductase subunit C|nr:4Fe-4S dicluster domain-containing protein [Terriglobales bacterium]
MFQFRKMKFQREAVPEWPHKVKTLPGCENIFSCIQCGTCSGTCPLSIYMDFTPRRIMSLLREGFRKEALGSETIWLCASCYSCAVHCPQDIHITDVMYSLKREAIKENLYPKRFPIPVLAREFYEIVKRRGRSSEMWLVLRMAFRSNPFILLGMAKSGWALLRTGRLSFKSEGIRNPKDLQRELAVKREVA